MVLLYHITIEFPNQLTLSLLGPCSLLERSALRCYRSQKKQEQKLLSMVFQQQRLPSRIVRIVMAATLFTAAFLYDANVVRNINDKNVVSSNEMKTVQKEKYGLASSKCTCVACNEDKVCGGLFRGNRYPGMPSIKEALRSKIHIVVSHCKKSLDWMPSYLEGFTNVKTIHIISKCGQKVVGAPDEAM
jgi:hypothetical protein